MNNKVHNIVVIDAHPDPSSERYVHALADAYCEGAQSGGSNVQLIRLCDVEVPILQSRDSWMNSPVPQSIKPAQDAIAWAHHIVFLYPLWMGDMPALLKAFLEQTMRPGFALDYIAPHGPKALLTGKSAHIVVTMGMPAFFYRAYYGAHSVRSFKRNILSLCGINTLHTSLIGNVEASTKHREKWLARMFDDGQNAE